MWNFETWEHSLFSIFDPKERRNPASFNCESQLKTYPFSPRAYASAVHLSNPKPGHTTGGSGRGETRHGWAGRGGAGRGGSGRRQVCSPSRQLSHLPSWESKTTVLDDFSETRTNEILCKPIEEQNPRLTTGLCAISPWDDQWTDAYVSLSTLCMQGMSGN